MVTTEFGIIFNVLLLVAIALLLARIFGYLFFKINQPAVIGEILAGIFLGGIILLFFSGQNFYLFDYRLPLPLLNFSSQNPDPFYFLAQIGILFILFISGLETRLSEIKRMEKTSSFVAVGGVIVPLFLGFFLGMIFGYGYQVSIVIGLILTATSVGVTVRTLMDINELDSDVGVTTLGAAVIDDVIGIILLALVIGAESLLGVAWIGLRIAIFFFIFLYIGLKIIDKILDLGDKINLPRALLSISLAILLIYSFFADRAGISGIIGAFIAGIIIGQNVRSRKIVEDVRSIGFGLFIPLFFVWVGVSLWQGYEASFESIIDILVLSILIIVIAIIGKIIGCGIGAKVAGLGKKESLQIGVGMIPRMELALIIVAAASTHGLLMGEIGVEIKIVTIIMAIATTVIAPFLIKATFR